ncbi:glycosyltransferase [Streptomyces sp. NPDC006743]|uniref:glycosyltransferase n=1 Tax=Streptomyces sp. NPDC006743 TaxID=3154480 RepID=UPI00345727B9
MPEHRLAVLLLTNEGFRQVDGGVARYIHNILDARDDVAALAGKRGIQVEWHVAERANCAGLDEQRFAQALERYVHQGSVRYHPLADPRAHSWEVDHFEHCVALGAAAGQAALTVAGGADSLLVVSGMSMFAMAARFIIRAADQFGLAASYVHMTHNPVLRPGGDAELPETYADSVMGNLARSDPRVSIGWESHWMRRQYQQVYGIPDDKTLYARAGVPTDAAKFRPGPSNGALLEQLGIPTDRDLVVSWGRGVAEKGFHKLVDAARLTEDRLVPVILNPRPYPDLEEHARRSGSPAVLLHGQDDEVLTALCQWPRTLCAAFLSEREAASVTPIEAALMNNGRGLVLAVLPTGVYPELVEHGVNGLVAAGRDTAAAAALLTAVVELPRGDREAMSRAAWTRARDEHDFRTNWRSSFKAMLERHLTVIDGPSRKEATV